MQLFADVVPRTAENFLALCTGMIEFLNSDYDLSPHSIVMYIMYGVEHFLNYLVAIILLWIVGSDYISSGWGRWIWKSIIELSRVLLLCCSTAGEKGIGKSTGKPLHFKGSHFHRIIKGFMAQVCNIFYLLNFSKIKVHFQWCITLNICWWLNSRFFYQMQSCNNQSN